MSKSNKTIVPEALKKGDHIAIIATARKVDRSLLESAEQVIRTWGLEPIRGANLLSEEHQFSGSDDQRHSDLQWAMDDPRIKAVFCYRGGYGTVRILEGLSVDQLHLHPKWFIGYSDVTALHQYLNTQANMASLHGTMPINFNENTSAALTGLKKTLFGKRTHITASSNKLNRHGEANAEVIGGNLAILQSLMGTPYELATKGKILFLEDVDEYLYNIDRMMWTLKLSGKLNHLAGLIIGGMTEMNDHEIPFGTSAQESILEKVIDYNYPVCFDFPAGHIDDNNTIPLGVKLNLIVDKKGAILRD